MLVTRFPVLLAVIGMSQKLANKQFLSVKVNGTDESVPVPPYVEDVKRATRLYLDRISGRINAANVFDTGPICAFRSAVKDGERGSSVWKLLHELHQLRLRDNAHVWTK